MKIVMGENLVYHSRVQVGSHHYARLFASENDVLWLSIPWNVFLLFKYGLKSERFIQWNKGRVFEEEGIRIWCPLTAIPYRDNMFFRSENNIIRQLKYTIPNLNAVLKKTGFQKCDVLWITDPRMIYLSEMIDYKVLVYRCVDELSHFTGIPDNIQNAEKKLAQKADIVFATADSLRIRLESYGCTVYSLPNAVDYLFFSEYDIRGKRSRIDNLDNVILYVGTIGEWFDCEFIRYCALKRKEYTFVMIGPERTNTCSLNGISNVLIMGSINYNEVPLYMKKARIGIIPFKKNDLVNAVNPLKLYEYFACNIPVVATASKEMIKMNSPAYLYSDYEEAISYFDDIFENDYIYDYSDYARDNSWQNRYEYIMNCIDNTLGSKT